MILRFDVPRSIAESKFSSLPTLGLNLRDWDFKGTEKAVASLVSCKSVFMGDCLDKFAGILHHKHQIFPRGIPHVSTVLENLSFPSITSHLVVVL